jgi:hypothetical protein
MADSLEGMLMVGGEPHQMKTDGWTKVISHNKDPDLFEDLS